MTQLVCRQLGKLRRQRPVWTFDALVCRGRTPSEPVLLQLDAKQLVGGANGRKRLVADSYHQAVARLRKVLKGCSRTADSTGTQFGEERLAILVEDATHLCYQVHEGHRRPLLRLQEALDLRVGLHKAEAGRPRGKLLHALGAVVGDDDQRLRGGARHA